MAAAASIMGAPARAPYVSPPFDADAWLNTWLTIGKITIEGARIAFLYAPSIVAASLITELEEPARKRAVRDAVLARWGE